ncbi:MAG: crossover junction endodeoxyribonuclease RuvC [Pseudomonadota bacterium]|nr:crossover junction endodeoxyribonuclease RuvC [Pseudomonadota bacterium]
MARTRILGIDPGSRLTGYGIVESDGRRSVHVRNGCIRAGSGPLPERLGIIYREVEAIVADYRPGELAVEAVFVARNAASALKLGHARGAAICAGVHHGLPVSEYSARVVKQALVGSGAADKRQVRHMVARLLSVDDDLQEDAADALAVALCHAHTRSTLGRYHIAGSRR